MDRVSAYSDAELHQKLAEVCIEQKNSTPWVDGDYRMARSPFDRKFYVFALLAIFGRGSSNGYARPSGGIGLR